MTSFVGTDSRSCFLLLITESEFRMLWSVSVKLEGKGNEAQALPENLPVA